MLTTLTNRMDYVDQVKRTRVGIRWVIADAGMVSFCVANIIWPELGMIVKVTGRRSTDDKRRKPERVTTHIMSPDAQHLGRQRSPGR